MPYKDKEKSREAATERQRKHRQGVTQEGVTGQGVTDEGVTRIELIQRELNDDYLIKGIEAAAVRFNDRGARHERAYRYNQWQKSEKIDPTIPYALVEDRTRLEKIYQSLSDFKQTESVYYGCGKDSVPFDVVGDLLEVTK